MATRKLYNGREYKWWIVMNTHFCKFCWNKNAEAVSRDVNHPGRLGLQCLKRRNGKGQYSKGYWNTMAAIFAQHIKHYHPEVKITMSKD